MDLNDLWQEHKKFIIAMVAGLLVFLIAESVIASKYGNKAEQVQRTLSQHERSLRAVKPNAANLAAVRTFRNAYRERLDALVQRTQFVPEDRFVLRDDEPRPDDVYFQAVNKVRDEVTDRAERYNISFPDNLGMPAEPPRQRDLIKRHLIALDMIRRVIGEAVESRVKSIDDIKVLIDTKAKRRTQRREESSFVHKLEVTFTLHGTSPALVQFLEALQKPEHHLTLGDPTQLSSLEARTGLMEAKVTVGALDFVATEEAQDDA